MPHVTFVKKILSSGKTCSRCLAVRAQLKADGLLNSINHVIVADDNNTDSIGLRLAKQYAVEKVPFFIVDDELGKTHIFQDYQEFKHFIQT